MITQASVHEMLIRAGAKLVKDVDSRIGFVVSSAQGEAIVIMVEIVGEGEILQFRTVQMLNATNKTHRRALLEAIGIANEQYKIGKFALDEDDGEVVAYVDIFLGRNDLTQTQMDRYVRALTQTVPMVRQRMAKIDQTGIAPTDDTQAALAELLGQLEKSIGAKGEGGNGAGTAKSGNKERPPGGEQRKRRSGGMDGMLNDILNRP